LALPAGAVRDAVLAGVHEQLAHPSSVQLQDTVSARYFVPGLKELCQRLTDACKACFESRPMTVAWGYNGRYDTPTHPFHTITIDLATGLRDEGKGFDAILVIVCDLTKMVRYEPTSMSATAEDFVALLQRSVFRNWGVPSVIKCDQQSAFMGHVFTKWAKTQGIEVRESTVEHHQATVEQAINVLRVRLRAVTDRQGLGWEAKLWQLEQAVNMAHVQDGDGKSPFQRLLGYQPPLPLLQAPPLPVARTALQEERAQGWLRPSFTELVDNYRVGRAEVAERHDHGRHEGRLAVGGLVAVPAHLAHTATTKFEDARARKSRAIFVGPFTVTAAAEGDNWLVNLGNNKVGKFHVSVLKPLPAEAGVVPQDPSQPAELVWTDGTPKVRIAVDRRRKYNNVEYLVYFWGQHEVQGRWVRPAEVPRDRVRLREYDARAEKGLPSRVPGAVVDLSKVPGASA
jgi:hypothetical protein